MKSDCWSRTIRWAVCAASAAAITACAEGGAVNVESIRAKIDNGELGAAVVDLKTALQTDPDSAGLRLLLGRILLIQEQPVLAEVELRKAMLNATLRSDAIPLIADAMLQSMQRDKLIDEFAGVKLDRRDADVSLRTSIADAAAQAGKVELANSALDAVLKESPEYGRALVLDARRMLTAGNAAGALKKLESLVAREPANVDALLLMADLRAFTDNSNDAALALYRKALTIKKNSVLAHSAVIVTLLRKNDLPGAQAALADMQKSSPAHVQTKFMETRVAFAKSDFKRARDLAQQVLSASPDSVSAQMLMAMVEMRTGNLQRAEALLIKSIQQGTANNSARRMLAEVHLRSGHGEKALATLKPMLDAEQASVQVLKLAADAAMQIGDVSKAAVLYAAAAKAKPDDAKLQTAMALADIAKGKTDDGLNSLRAISGANAQDTTADMALMASLLQRDDFDGALRALDVVGSKTPDAPGIDLMRGRIHLLRRDRIAARLSFETAVQKYPKSFTNVAALAMLDASESNMPGAIQRYEAFLKTDPSAGAKSTALRSLAGVKFSAKAPLEEVLQLLRDAVKADPTNEASAVMLVDGLLRARQVEAALAAAQSALTSMRESPTVLDALGRAQLAAGDLRQSAATFTKVARLQPRSAIVPLRLAQIQLLSNDLKGATGNLVKSLSLDPDLSEAQADLAKLAAHPGQLQSVLAAVRGMQRQFPDQAFPHRIEGDLHLARRAFDDAVVAYRKGAGKARPGRLPVRLHRAYLSARKTGDAQQFASEWMKTHPSDAAFVQHVADHAMSVKDYAAAEVAYRQVVQIMPSHNTALNNLAWLLTRSNQPGAVAFAERAVKAAPGQTAVMDTLAHALAAERQHDRAVELATKILTLEPTSPAFQLSMAKVFARAGQPKKALDTLALLDKSSANDALKAEAATMRQKLASGG